MVPSGAVIRTVPVCQQQGVVHPLNWVPHPGQPTRVFSSFCQPNGLPSAPLPCPTKAYHCGPPALQRLRQRNRAVAEPLPSAASVSLNLEVALERMRHSMRQAKALSRSSEAVLTGRGRHLGINIMWNLRWRPDGAFVEQVVGKEMRYQWGHNGGVDSMCWEVDSSGISRFTECDDHEALWLSTLVRTGCWLQPAISQHIHMELQPFSSAPARKASSSGRKRTAGLVAGKPSSSASSQHPNNSAALGGCSNSNSRSQEAQALLPLSVMNPALFGAETVPDFEILVRLRNGRLMTRVYVSGSSWQVTGLEQQLCGDQEIWRFGPWERWHDSILYPGHLTHSAAAGGSHTYVTESASVQALSPLSAYQIPPSAMLPSDTRYDPSISPEVPVWRAASGHLLVQPLLNGKPAGFMILDTGASGFVITPQAAAALDVAQFGEVYAASISGKVQVAYIKVQNWSLGPLHIQRAIMMTMNLDGLVRGAPGPVIGIVGYDVFRRAVVELPCTSVPARHTSTPSSDRQKRRFSSSSSSSSDSSSRLMGSSSDVADTSSGSSLTHISRSNHSSRSDSSTGDINSSDCTRGVSWSPLAAHARKDPAAAAVAAVVDTPADSSCQIAGDAASFSSNMPVANRDSGSSGGGSCSGDFQVRLFSPDAYTEQQAEQYVWFPVKMISSLPHVEVGVVDSTGAHRRVLLMVDSGACGMDIMLHSRGVKELQLDTRDGHSSHRFVRGVGGDSKGSVRTGSVQLPWMDIGSLRFDQVRCMYEGAGGLDISVYSAGILCGDLMGRLPMAIDFTRKRIGFLLSHVDADR